MGQQCHDGPEAQGGSVKQQSNVATVIENGSDEKSFVEMSQFLHK